MHFEFFSLEIIQEWIQQYGYWIVFLGIMLENAGIPLPGETISYKNNSNVTIFNFEPNIEKYMTLSDLVITRAGSSTLSELAFLQIPFIAIPFKDSLDNHQFYNADYFFRMNACWLIDQQDLSSEKLFDLVTELIRNKEKLLEKKSKLKELSKRDVNEIFEKEINKILA